MLSATTLPSLYPVDTDLSVDEERNPRQRHGGRGLPETELSCMHDEEGTGEYDQALRRGFREPLPQRAGESAGDDYFVPDSLRECVCVVEINHRQEQRVYAVVLLSAGDCGFQVRGRRFGNEAGD